MVPSEAQVMHCEDTGECSQEISELEITRHSTTAKTEVDDAAAVAESTIEASLDGEKVAEIAQSALLNRESAYPMRSEERRVGKEGRARWGRAQQKKKKWNMNNKWQHAQTIGSITRR